MNAVFSFNARVFDAFRDWWEGPQARRVVTTVLIGGFFITLLLVEGNRQGWMRGPLAQSMGTNHFRAIDIAFTRNDAGSVFNVAGAARIDASDRGEMADRFVRHLLSSEAQEYFAVTTFEYPLVDGIDPVGRLPQVSELAVPDIDLSQLSQLDETVGLMREVGVL